MALLSKILKLKIQTKMFCKYSQIQYKEDRPDQCGSVGWLSPQSRRSPVGFPARAHALVAGSSLVGATP